jgi:hypothetical protein
VIDNDIIPREVFHALLRSRLQDAASST